MPAHLGEVKEEDEEYVLPPCDLGEVKKDVEKDDHDHPRQLMGYWTNRSYWKKSCAYHQEPSLLLVA
jgi:hypothetical protein